jgi:rubrerythrin
MDDRKGLCGHAASGEPAGLPEAVVHALDTALEDERRAFETYSAILDRFEDARPFVNIVEAEARHIDALLGVYARYGLRPPPDETLPDEAALTAPLTELCEVGVWAEIENVELYDKSLLPAVADYPDISAVFTRLRDASEHRHLPAFQRCVDRGGQGRRAGGRRREFNAFPGREDARSSPGNG